MIKQSDHEVGIEAGAPFIFTRTLADKLLAHGVARLA